ncbi:lipid-binding protein [Pedobacter psychrophilus]|uniref:Lipid-binding protein n=1 Tax=Pedobacter psychrophilus TaxID=1826909 RepID=A0A179DCP4_9SPHI|nr:YceI family protein [Pedobacter psychrophilus]OAQ38748.1 lipid-binding protein [Pedobacter psychrophilus]
MKKIVLSIVAITGLFFAFKPAANVYTVDVSKSKIEWIGKKITGQHTGEIKLADGTLSANGSKLVGGAFNIDMSTMTCTDLDATNGGKLLGHLKSPDFFSVEKNPTSNFQITNVTAIDANKVNITGNLTIKGINNKITFPASVQQKGSFIVAVASGVKVDRTKYDIKYGSKNFIAGIGDKAIDDEFELNINLVAKK